MQRVIYPCYKLLSTPLNGIKINNLHHRLFGELF
jgi:hypothetical protein